jgi:hypothetical protein
MVRQAETEALRAREDGNTRGAFYAEGWQDALLTFREYLAGGVRASCFPIGSCPCHPTLR